MCKLLLLLLSQYLQSELVSHGFAELILVPLLSYDFCIFLL